MLPQIAPKAKRAIYISLIGAPSQIDLFDYKPDLQKRFKEDLNGYLKAQGEPNYIDGVLEGGTVDSEGGDLGGDFSQTGGKGDEKDPMYDQAVEVVLKNRKASISLVQRHLKIGYNRSARMLEEMEKAGLISAMSGSGQREILVPVRAE